MCPRNSTVGFPNKSRSKDPPPQVPFLSDFFPTWPPNAWHSMGAQYTSV